MAPVTAAFFRISSIADLKPIPSGITFQSTEEKRLGWVSLPIYWILILKMPNYALGDYLIFFLCRIDRKLIPPKLMKVRLIGRGKNVFLPKAAKTGSTNKWPQALKTR